MLIHLIKKDILIAKKYAILVILIGFVIPLFVFWRSQKYSETLGFVLAVVFSEFMFCQNLSMKESIYSKATALLCTTPYPRRLMVVSKYAVFVITFLYCAVAYGIDVLLFPQIGQFDLKYIFMIFLLVSIIYGIYMPVQYKLGYDKTKIFFMIVILLAPFGLPALMTYSNIDLSFCLKYPSFLIIAVELIASICVLSVSLAFTIRIFKNKELV